MLFNFGPRKNPKKNSKNKSQAKPKSQYNNSHFLKPDIHNNFSKDPDLALIFLDLNFSPQIIPPLAGETDPKMKSRGREGYADLFTQTLKKLNLKKNLILFSRDLSQANLNKNSKYFAYQQDQILAMTEKTGGWLLRSSSGKTYAVQHVLLILDLPNNLNLDSLALSQSDNLLLQNLSTQGYLIPHEQHSGIKRSEIGASLSENPRISQKLFIWDASKKDQDPTDLLAHTFN